MPKETSAPKEGNRRPTHGRSIEKPSSWMDTSERLLHYDTLQRATLAPQTLSPTDVLSLQHTVGNATVQRILNGSGEAPDPMVDGGTTDSDTERAIRNPSGGRPLPETIRRQIEPRLGTDLDGVRVHTDSRAADLNRQLSAKAFTHGNHIFYGKGQSPHDLQLTAHEAVHTVQQRGLQRTVADGVIQRSFGDIFKGMFGGKKSSSKEDGDKGSKSSSPQQRDLSHEIEYERRLGRYAYNHPKAKEAAKVMLGKITTSMVGEVDEESEQQTKQLVELLGKDDVTSSGQVGKTKDAILGVIREGNLRERMTAIMNAAYSPMFKGYLGKLFSFFGKTDWEDVKARGFDVEKLKRRGRQRRWNIGAGDPYRDPGNPFDRKRFKSFQFLGKTRIKNNKSSDRTVDDLSKGSDPIGLSEREKSFMFGSDSGDVTNKNLKWQEGGTYYTPNKKNSWVKKVTSVLHMPVKSGPSGTMLRMFQLWEWLNKPVPREDWRLAVMAWMLTGNDHSFHELMLAASDYGLPYKPGPLAYVDIPPLSVGELRDEVAPNGLFPHEVAYGDWVKERSLKKDPTQYATSQKITEASDYVELADPEQIGPLSGPSAMSVILYTGAGYGIMNPLAQGGMFTEKKIWHNIKSKKELSWLKTQIEQKKITMSQVVAEFKRHTEMLHSSLDMMPDIEADVYRGEAHWNGLYYRVGSTVSFDKFISTSKDESVAKHFADNYHKSSNKYILHMHLTAGKDVDQLSENQSSSEKELLVTPGSAFRVTRREKKVENQVNYYHIYMTQTKRGGRKLLLTSPRSERESSELDFKDSRDIEISSFDGDGPELDAPPSKPKAKPKFDKFVLQPGMMLTAVYDDSGTPAGMIPSGTTIGITGVIKEGMCELIWKGKTVYASERMWQIGIHEPYPEKSTEVDAPEDSVSEKLKTIDEVEDLPKQLSKDEGKESLKELAKSPPLDDMSGKSPSKVEVDDVPSSSKFDVIENFTVPDGRVIMVNDAENLPLGVLQGGTTVGITGVVKNGMCEFVWRDRLAYASERMWQMMLGTKYPVKS